MFVFDDLDGLHDTEATVQKKIDILTKTILGSAGPNPIIIFIQNKITSGGIMARLLDDRADFLQTRITDGPIPAVEDLELELQYDEDLERNRYVITAGRPTWVLQDLAVCQKIIDDEGPSAFKAECQHETSVRAGGIFSHLEYVRVDREECPDFVDVTCWVDPAVSSTDKSDSMGIQCDALGTDERLYRLYSWERRATPLEAIKRAILIAIEHSASTLGVETDQGGDTWHVVFESAVAELQEAWTAYCNEGNTGHIEPYVLVGFARIGRLEYISKEGPLLTPEYVYDKAGAGHGSKVHRSSQVVASYELDQIRHVRGTHKVLEDAQYRFPDTKPLDPGGCRVLDLAHADGPRIRSPKSVLRNPLQFRGAMITQALTCAVAVNLLTWWFEPIQPTKNGVLALIRWKSRRYRLLRGASWVVLKLLTCPKCCGLWGTLSLTWLASGRPDIQLALLVCLFSELTHFVLSYANYWYHH